MLKILSFILLIVILIIILFGTDVMNKTNLGDTQLLTETITIKGLYVSESEDKSGEFSGYSHFFYLYLEQPTTGTSNAVIKREITGSEGIKIVLDKHNVMKITVRDGASNIDELSYFVPLGRWVNFCVNVNEFAIELYVNGSLMTSIVNTQRQETSDLYDSDITIGGSTDKGWISSYKYFDKALTSQEINKMYQNNVNKYNNLKDEFGLRFSVKQHGDILYNYEI
mgnify:CR=1 FL=1